MVFGSAKQAEVIRSHQKDDYYTTYIKGSLADIVQSFFGPRNWIKWRKELDLAADVGYFFLTTVAGYQTLGEEYVNIVLTDETKRSIPSQLNRVLMVLLQVGVPYAIDKFLSYCERQLQQNVELELTDEGRTRLLEIIPVLRHVVLLLHRCHLAMFYMKGIFYHIAKRMMGLHYVLVRDTGQQERASFRILGWLAVIQLAATFCQQLYKMATKVNSVSTDKSTTTVGPVVQSSTEESARYNSPATKCSLCLEPRKNSTATPCGHLFCWTCIHEWCNNKAECPLCRESFQLSRLIPLQNYDPV